MKSKERKRNYSRLKETKKKRETTIKTSRKSFLDPGLGEKKKGRVT